MLTENERRTLLTLARETITQAVRDQPLPTVPPEEMTERLQAPGASFVTLHTKAGALRGCIGSLAAYRPLVEDVQANALAAAFRDPRFPPVSERELAKLVVEVSVLSDPQPLAFDGPEDLVRKLRPGVDGVVLRRGWHRATFLPQVWEQLPVPEVFLSQLCYKAGLPLDAWKQPGIEVEVYQVEKFSEA